MKALFSRFKKQDKEQRTLYRGLNINVKDGKYILDFGGGKIIREDDITFTDIMDVILGLRYGGSILIHKRHGITEEIHSK